MAIPPRKPELFTPAPGAALRRGRALEALAPWIIAAIVITGLYFGRSILLPIILSILLSFLLAPIVAGFRRLRLPRAPAVLLSIVFALGVIGVTSAIIVSQATTLAKDAPAYAERITAKATAIRSGIRDRFGAILQTGDGGSGDEAARDARNAGAQAMKERAEAPVVPVQVSQPKSTALDEIRNYVVPALAPIETTVIVLVVTIFILFQKEDLRDRLIRLMGAADLHRTTVALDEGAKRLSRYFLSQAIVNLGFGAILWAGLYLIGVPSPGLWGVLAGLLRFVPYVGILVAAVPPLALAAAVDPGWMMVIYVVGLFLVIELIVGYVIEPLFYGHSTGLSPVSVLVSALFWTWLWGPAGLVLSMPMTLMLVVLGRHIPAFEMFDIILGDRPALSPAEAFYQRALAGHIEEAIEQAEDHLDTRTLAEYYDQVVLGGLRLAVADVDRGAVERAALKAVGENTLEILTALDVHEAMLALPSTSDAQAGAPESPQASDGASIICMPGRGPLDAAVARMTAQLLRRQGFDVVEQTRSPSDHSLPATVPTFICVLGLFDERSYRRIRPIIANLAKASPDATVIVGVTRAEDQLFETDGGLAPSLEALCQAIAAEGAVGPTLEAAA